VSTEPAPAPVPAPRSRLAAPGDAGAATVLARSRDELAVALADAPDPRAVVMTMGALHEGHFDLVREAARRVGPAGTVVVTIFVNPLQFAPTEDLDSYPRDLEGDLAGLTQTLTGVDGALGVGRLVVFAPTPEVIYPAGQPAVRIDPGPIATVLEGRTRPTHFAGVCQVVLTLMHLTAPRWALFGRKDAQQLAIIEAMVRDLAVPVEIVPVDIRRESDGLAMSSRNAYLSPEQRRQALALSRALQAGQDVAAQAAGSSLRTFAQRRTDDVAQLMHAPWIVGRHGDDPRPWGSTDSRTRVRPAHRPPQSRAGQGLLHLVECALGSPTLGFLKFLGFLRFPAFQIRRHLVPVPDDRAQRHAPR